MWRAILRRYRNLCLIGFLLFAFYPVQGEEHHAPRGGTLLELGEEFAQIEFIHDSQQGSLTAYILDGEAENPVRLRQPTIDLVIDEASYAGVRKASFSLHLKAVPHALTGETVGDTSEFAVDSVDSLRGATSLRGRIQRITVRSTTFKEVRFSIPSAEASKS
jgi:hypothetical protein